MAKSPDLIPFTNAKTGKPHFVNAGEIVSAVANWEENQKAKTVISTKKGSYFLAEAVDYVVKDIRRHGVSMIMLHSVRPKQGEYWINPAKMISVVANWDGDERAKTCISTEICNVFVTEMTSEVVRKATESESVAAK